MTSEGTSMHIGEPEDFGDEAWLQAVVAISPGVLEGGEKTPSSLCPWLLIGEQISVSPEENGDALDLLFLDHEVLPVIVEAKRGKQRGVSRSAIGQLLDYAAAMSQWSAQDLRRQFVRTCTKNRVDPEQTFRGMFGEKCQDEVWRQAATNLSQRRVRLLIAADCIPAKLCRIADFLNAEMEKTRVVTCEVIEHEVAGQPTWLPKVVHRAEIKERHRANFTTEGARWAASFFFKKLGNPEDEQTVRKILAWAQAHDLQIQMGLKENEPSYLLSTKHGRQKGIELIIIRARKNPWVELMLKRMKNVPPFTHPQRHHDLEERWKKLPGVRNSAYRSFPNINLSALAADVALHKLFETLSWIVQQIKAA